MAAPTHLGAGGIVHKLKVKALVLLRRDRIEKYF
jgi:hypothetical protein